MPELSNYGRLSRFILAKVFGLAAKYLVPPDLTGWWAAAANLFRVSGFRGLAASDCGGGGGGLMEISDSGTNSDVRK